MNWKGLIDYILARLGENSTWRGIAMFVAACGVKNMSDNKWAAITAVALSVIAAINVFRNTTPKPPTTP